MIIETIIENNLIERKSDKGVRIKNLITNNVYDIAVDLTNEERAAKGLEPYYYTETNIPIDTDQLTDSEALAIITGEAE